MENFLQFREPTIRYFLASLLQLHAHSTYLKNIRQKKTAAPEMFDIPLVSLYTIHSCERDPIVDDKFSTLTFHRNSGSCEIVYVRLLRARYTCQLSPIPIDVTLFTKGLFIVNFYYYYFFFTCNNLLFGNVNSICLLQTGSKLSSKKICNFSCVTVAVFFYTAGCDHAPSTARLKRIIYPGTMTTSTSCRCL